LNRFFISSRLTITISLLILSHVDCPCRNSGRSHKATSGYRVGAVFALCGMAGVEASFRRPSLILTDWQGFSGCVDCWTGLRLPGRFRYTGRHLTGVCCPAQCYNGFFAYSLNWPCTASGMTDACVFSSSRYAGATPSKSCSTSFICYGADGAYATLKKVGHEISGLSQQVFHVPFQVGGDFIHSAIFSIHEIFFISSCCRTHRRARPAVLFGRHKGLSRRGYFPNKWVMQSNG